ncbi:hypothetical protein GF339_13300 [candidate division KSB3 bacterium]|uniref:S-adenosyl-l-methionine hydroxide adenosyltransferase n=1 Tax=candidate division KSB3 bacterium TaxID=2044937 RepID=A0A9D5Q6B7_9BACT|nr:hypothetical protein [candidate division KSB3 bacterium]MBD3325560.1 hypothetical protein [candidate division KSB3 bacterium]
MATTRPIITLLTDFGEVDHFVGVMKGVILNIHSDVEIVDISHSVSPQNIRQAGFLLSKVYPYFPPETIHVVVVDPGVGTDRKALLVSSEQGYFIAPDNGVLSYVYQDVPVTEVREITADHYFLKPRSGTFDGRDVFAPVAAWLARGVSPSSFGEPVAEYATCEISQPVAVKDGALRCEIIHVDRFGNLVSNLSRERFEAELANSKTTRFAFRIGEQTVSTISQAYQAAEPGELIAIFGSAGLLEFSINQGNAAASLSLGAGADFWLKVV